MVSFVHSHFRSRFQVDDMEDVNEDENITKLGNQYGLVVRYQPNYTDMGSFEEDFDDDDGLDGCGKF